MRIDIEKKHKCYRCCKNTVSEKERTGIVLSYKDTNVYLCNDCAWEIGLAMAEAVRENRRNGCKGAK